MIENTKRHAWGAFVKGQSKVDQICQLIYLTIIFINSFSKIVISGAYHVKEKISTLLCSKSFRVLRPY